ncbi:hypothetical protein ACIBKX_13175 [Streptomyces sp. NPDC050658]
MRVHPTGLSRTSATALRFNDRRSPKPRSIPRPRPLPKPGTRR